MQLPKNFVAQFLLAAAIGLSGDSTASAEEVKFWMRAFNPNEHPSNPEYISQHPTDQSKWIIPAPSLGIVDHIVELGSSVPIQGTCFGTDHRGFSSAKNARGKMHVAFQMNPEKNSVSPLDGNQTVLWPGQSYAYNCETGKQIGQLGGKMKTHSVSRLHVAGSRSQVIFQIAAALPYVTGSAWIDGSGSVTYDKSNQTLSYEITIDNFPAFEAYAQLEDGSVVTLFQEFPTGDTVWSLYDLGVLKRRTLKGTVHLLPIVPPNPPQSSSSIY